MWTVGLWILLFGYAVVYTGLGNLRSGGQGPTLRQALGWEPVVVPGGLGNVFTGSRESRANEPGGPKKTS